jgi:hypothetical protein
MPPAHVRALIPFIHNQGLTPLATIYHPHKCGFNVWRAYARGTFRCPLRGQFNQPARLISPCRLARFNPSDREDFTCANKAQHLSFFRHLRFLALRIEGFRRIIRAQRGFPCKILSYF